MTKLEEDHYARGNIRANLMLKWQAIATKTKDPSAVNNWKPNPSYPIYVCWLYADPNHKWNAGPYVVGFERKEEPQPGELPDYAKKAWDFANQIKEKSHCVDVIICDSYPWEIMGAK